MYENLYLKTRTAMVAVNEITAWIPNPAPRSSTMEVVTTDGTHYLVEDRTKLRFVTLGEFVDALSADINAPIPKSI